MMNKLKYLILSVLAAMTAACSGKTDPTDTDLPLVLTADRTEVVADGSADVVFTVKHGTTDVSSEAVISCKTEGINIKGNIFSPVNEGIYSFTASYEGKTSNEVKITVTVPEASRFARHVCVMEFTGTWCSRCPSGAIAINYLVEEAYKGKAFAMAFHNDDIYQIPQEQELFKKFQFGAYPGFVVDMRDAGCVLDGGCSLSIEKSLYESITHCGVALECKATENADGSTTITADAKIFSEKSMNYRLAAYIIEDKVKGEQLQGDNQMDYDYTHRHIVRKMLSSSIVGDDMGNIAGGKESGKSYRFEVDKTWNIENLSVAVLALNEEGHVNNMAICSCLDGKMDYELND